MEWSIGDKVTVLSGYSSTPSCVRTIVKLSSRVTLNDGSQWIARNGIRFGSGDSYHASYIVPHKDQHDEIIMRNRYRQEIGHTNWNDPALSLDDLREIYLIIKAAKAKAAENEDAK